ncbi:MAG: hypothetical protein IH591_13455, partial [Bacteroidales bacterium]|nr:hypothetical protein [Bacteroidales bacterium]
MVRLLLLLIISLPLSFDTAIASHNAEPVRGVLDLRDAKIDAKYIIKLNGEWEFYWNQHLRPYHFKGNIAPRPDGYIKVPSYWTDAKIPGIITEGKGYATYRLLILLPADINVPLGLDVKVFDSSYDLYVNGIFLGSNGVSGASAESSLPGYEPRIYKLPSGGDTTEIIFNVSNFHHRRGGFWLPVEFGTFREVQSVAARRFGAAISNVSILSAFFVFFIFFFLIYREDKITLYFAIALLGMAVRPLVTNQFIIYLFLRPDWQWIIRMEYLSLYVLLTGGFLFIYELFKSQYQRFFAILAPTLFSLMAIATLILPVSAFSYLTLPSYLFVFIFAFNSIFCSAIQLYTKRKGVELLYFFGFILIVYAAIHDVLLSAKNSSGYGVYILSETIIAFIFIQAGLLIFKWVKSFREKERLKNNLEQMNRNLESIVNKRTKELIDAKNQAEEYSKQIERQNADLTETIHLKNKVFSVIAHDLRSPVVNIQYILNLLKEDEFRDKYESLAGSCINYSQMVINLLENMLVWGRGQEDMIRYAPAENDLSDIILTN